ncbi:hypothetical protein [Neisseria sp. HMSC064E01]|jgi:hypothetical protein|nr:hypothetical protein [Neisseria sp. HMSC064E01]
MNKNHLNTAHVVNDINPKGRLKMVESFSDDLVVFTIYGLIDGVSGKGKF